MMKIKQIVSVSRSVVNYDTDYCLSAAITDGSLTDSALLSLLWKERKVQGSNVQFKSWLNQLSLSHESNKKRWEEKNKRKTDKQLSPEMVVKIREIRPEWWGRLRWHSDRESSSTGWRSTLGRYWRTAESVIVMSYGTTVFWLIS